MTAVAAVPRFDVYTTPHKGLRAFLFDTLQRLERLDLGDEAEVARFDAQLRQLLHLCELHQEHETAVLHAALDARCRGVAATATRDHAAQRDDARAMLQQLEALAGQRGARRAEAATALRRLLTRYVAEQLEHMALEETRHHEALWAAYSDEELLGLQRAIVGGIAPADMAVFLRWMFPAMTHAERVELLSGMRAAPRPEPFVAALSIACAHLSERDGQRLLAALGVPAEPSRAA